MANPGKRAEVLLNFHNGLLLLAREKLEPYFAAVGDLNFRAATDVLTKKTDSATLSSSAQVISDLRLSCLLCRSCSNCVWQQDVTKTKFWSELSLPMKLFSDCERVYYAVRKNWKKNLFTLLTRKPQTTINPLVTRSVIWIKTKRVRR